MKELSIEEKAKAYDEAIEKAKGVIEQNPLMEYLKKGIEYIFPELAESKDERIRKVIYGWICTQPSQFFDNGFSKEEMLAWLEKQGKNNMGISEATKKKLEDNLNKALEKETPESWNEFLDEQKPVDKIEQKPAWSEDDIMHIDNLIAIIESRGYPDYVEYLERLKYRILWKPSDTQMKALNDINLTGGISYVGQGQELITLYNDLKKLKGEEV